MTNKLALSLTMLLALSFAASGWAGSLKVEPGLWKATVTTNRGGQPAAPHTNEHCITQQDIDDFGNKLATPHNSPQANCQRTSFKETSNSVDFKYECTGQFAMTSEGSIKFDSPAHYTGTVKTKGDMMGHPFDATTAMEGTRVGTCPPNGSGSP